MDIRSRRTASPFSSALAAFPGKLAQISPGASSYFTAPTSGLDPHLFDENEKMHLPVRNWLVRTVHAELAAKGFRGSERWLRVWLAGSGASYQWSAARDPGDLDILLGVDYARFREANVEYTGMSDKEISDDINDQLQAELWKRTASQELNGAVYEVTWYVNPGSTDIRAINPYAAYDVDQREWTVRPIDLPAAGPGEWFDQSYADAVEADRQRAQEIIDRYNRARDEVATATGPRWFNATTALTQASKDAVELYDSIHKGRHVAFEEQGQGYRDFANYRWQRGKLVGHVQALQAIKNAVKEAQKDAEYRLYGGELKSAEKVLIAAALRRNR